MERSIISGAFEAGVALLSLECGTNEEAWLPNIDGCDQRSQNVIREFVLCRRLIGRKGRSLAEGTRDKTCEMS
jgi:hypothetical protein